MNLPLIQVFKNTRIFKKRDYTPEARTEWFEWPQRAFTSSGIFSNGKLKLPEDSPVRANLADSGLLLLVDPKIEGAHSALETGSRIFRMDSRASFFPVESWSYRFELFSLVKQGDGFDLYLEGERLSHVLGMPARTMHKCGELKLGAPLRFRINGESDFSMSSRQQRRFMEFDYLIEFVGMVHEVEFVEAAEVEFWREFDQSNWREVNERKALY